MFNSICNMPARRGMTTRAVPPASPRGRALPEPRRLGFLGGFPFFPLAPQPAKTSSRPSPPEPPKRRVCGAQLPCVTRTPEEQASAPDPPLGAAGSCSARPSCPGCARGSGRRPSPSPPSARAAPTRALEGSRPRGARDRPTGWQSRLGKRERGGSAGKREGGAWPGPRGPRRTPLPTAVSPTQTKP